MNKAFETLSSSFTRKTDIIAIQLCLQISNTLSDFGNVVCIYIFYFIERRKCALHIQFLIKYNTFAKIRRFQYQTIII